jgi:hypothetical protein
LPEPPAAPRRFCRDEGSPPHWAPAARLCAAETARCPQARFLLEVTASQAILIIEAPDRDGLLEMLVSDGISRGQAPPDDS